MVQLGILILIALGVMWAVSLVVGIAGLILKLLVWVFIGYLAGQILRGKGYGPIGDAALGLGGGIVGNIIFDILGIGFGGAFGYVLAGVAGALVLVYAVRLFGGKQEFAK